MTDQLNEWDAASAEEISTAELDALVVEMQAQWLIYEALNEDAKAQRAKHDATEAKLLDLLKKAKKTKWQVDGVGTAYLINKYQYVTPKTVTDKQRLFNYIKLRHGDEALMGLLSINANTLNAFANKEKEESPLAEIPGLPAPTHRESLGFRKK